MQHRWLWLFGILPTMLSALPEEYSVTHGIARSERVDAHTLKVHTSDRAILEYRDFHLTETEVLRYEQPSSHSSVLARIHSDKPAQILGRLESNGRVFLVSPGGLYFGPDSRVDVGALIASTLDITNEDFLAKRYQFIEQDAAGILAKGYIRAEEGVALLASSIQSEGTVVVKKGNVVIAAQERVALDITGEGKILFAVDEVLESFALDYVEMTAKKLHSAIQNVVNMETVEIAYKLIEKEGTIYLAGGHIETHEGNVTVSGKEVLLQEGTIDVSSAYAGGNITVQALSKLQVDPTFSLLADAKELGDGGTVLLWSEDSTKYNGQIFARGGRLGGRGGLVETSAQKRLEVARGKVDTSAVGGSLGIWLLDPHHITIVEGGEETSLANLKDCYDDISSYTISPSTLEQSFSHVHLCALAEEGKITIASPIHMQKEGVGLSITVHEESGQIELMSDIHTMSGQIRLEGPISLGEGGSRILNTTYGSSEKGASILLGGDVDGAVSLELIAGKRGLVQTTGSLGASRALQGFSVKEGSRFACSSDIITKGGDITITPPIALKGPVKLDTTARGASPQGANIAMQGSVDGTFAFTLDAGSQGKIFTAAKGSIGSQMSLAVVKMKGSDIFLQSDISASGGTIIFDGAVTMGNNLVLTDTGPTGVIFLGSVDSASGHNYSLNVNAPIGQAIFNAAVGGTQPIQNLTIAASGVTLGTTITLTGSMNVSGEVLLTDDSTISAPTIQFNGPINGSYDLTFNAGASGTIALNNAVGAQDRLAIITFAQAGTIATQAIFADQIVQTSATSSAFYGTLDTESSNGISLTGGTFVFDADIQTAGGGSFTIANTGTMTATSSIEVNTSGAFAQTGSGQMNWMGSIVTSNQNISCSGNIQLQGPLSVSTGSVGTGDVTFQGTVNGAYPLAIALGSGDLTCNGALGSTTALGDITIYSSRNVTMADVTATGLTQVGSIGTSNYLGNIRTSGLSGIHLTSTYLNFAGRTAGKVLKTEAGDVVLNSVYASINTSANPVVVDILRDVSSTNVGTLFVGTANVGFFVCNPSIQASCPAFLGSVRSNVPCFVEYNSTEYTPVDCPLPLH